MSPLHAKALLAALQQTLAIYEEKAGDLDFQKVLTNFGVNTAITAAPSE
jgi:hypothetical protein